MKPGAFQAPWCSGVVCDHGNQQEDVALRLNHALHVLHMMVWGSGNDTISIYKSQSIYRPSSTTLMLSVQLPLTSFPHQQVVADWKGGEDGLATPL